MPPFLFILLLLPAVAMAQEPAADHAGRRKDELKLHVIYFQDKRETIDNKDTIVYTPHPNRERMFEVDAIKVRPPLIDTPARKRMYFKSVSRERPNEFILAAGIRQHIDNTIKADENFFFYSNAEKGYL